MTSPDTRSRKPPLTWKDRAAFAFLVLVVLLAVVAGLRGVWATAVGTVFVTAAMLLARRATRRR